MATIVGVVHGSRGQKGLLALDLAPWADDRDRIRATKLRVEIPMEEHVVQVWVARLRVGQTVQISVGRIARGARSFAARGRPPIVHVTPSAALHAAAAKARGRSSR